MEGFVNFIWCEFACDDVSDLAVQGIVDTLTPYHGLIEEDLMHLSQDLLRTETDMMMRSNRDGPDHTQAIIGLSRSSRLPDLHEHPDPISLTSLRIILGVWSLYT